MHVLAIAIIEQLNDPDSYVRRLINSRARQLSQQPGFRESDREDIEQELAQELIEKLPGFDPKRARETTFVSCLIRRKLISLIRLRRAEKRDGRRNGPSLNDSLLDADGHSIERSQTLETEQLRKHNAREQRAEPDARDLQLDLESFLETLPDELRHVAEQLMENSKLGACRELGLSRRQLAHAVAALRERFEDAEIEAYLLKQRTTLISIA